MTNLPNPTDVGRTTLSLKAWIVLKLAQAVQVYPIYFQTDRTVNRHSMGVDYWLPPLAAGKVWASRVLQVLVVAAEEGAAVSIRAMMPRKCFKVKRAHQTESKRQPRQPGQIFC